MTTQHGDPALEQQLMGYRQTTAEILYHMPDHPGIVQSFVFQRYDLVPGYPELERFLAFWEREVEAKIHSVRVATRARLGAAEVGCAYNSGLVH